MSPPVSKIQTPLVILWDNDGVLVDSEREFFSLTQKCFGERGLELRPAFWATHFLGLGKRTYELAMLLGMQKQHAQELADWRDGLWFERLQRPVDLVLGAQECVRQLSTRFPMAIVTGAPRNHFEGLHAHHELLAHFQFAITQDECPTVKPNPAALLVATQRLHVDPNQCLLIEDSPRGLRAAQAIGMPCAILQSPLLDLAQCSGAHLFLNNLRDLLEYLRSELPS